MVLYEHADQEPALADILSDPIVVALMRYDAVEAGDISRLVERFSFPVA